MGATTLILVVGCGTAFLVVAVMAVYEWRRRRARPLSSPSLPGHHTLAQIGMNARAEMSLDTVVMRPTIGLRLTSLGFTVAAIWFIWGAVAHSQSHNEMLAVGTTALLLYMAAHVGMYEARYNAESLTAPDWFFVKREYQMTDFEAIGEDGKMLLKLKFGGKDMHLQRYLVGMPTFLTFMADVKAVNVRI